MLSGAQMYFASGILFILPCLLLYFAWQGFSRSEIAGRLPSWRRHVVFAALIVSAASTLLNLAWNVSWLHNGGSPHGLSAGPGSWQVLGPFLAWTFVIGTVLSV